MINHAKRNELNYKHDSRRHYEVILVAKELSIILDKTVTHLIVENDLPSLIPVVVKQGATLEFGDANGRHDDLRSTTLICNPSI